MNIHCSIQAAIATLEKKDKARKQFGAAGHQYRLNLPLTEPDVATFERRRGIRLPSEYRNFLVDVGNGGAGPYYGVFKLGEMDDGFSSKPWTEGLFVGALQKPWPHRRAWNLPADEYARHDALLRELPEDDLDDSHEAAIEALEAKYWNEELVAGAIPISHHGCALRDWLIVTGPEAGQVWYDGRVDREGLRPYERVDGHRLTFIEWYLDWLNEALAAQGLETVEQLRGRM